MQVSGRYTNKCLFKVLKISIHSYWGSHVGGQENAHQSIYPYNITENSPNSFTRSFVSYGPNDFKFGIETHIYCRIGHINIWDKSIIICIIIFLMMSYAKRQYETVILLRNYFEIL